MKKCLVISDSFKGTLSSVKICSLAEKSIKKIFPSCEVISIPVADGGEGTVDSFLSILKGEKISIDVKGPFFEDVHAYYGMFGKKAVIEMAQAAGLPLVEGRPDPLRASTYGVGQMIDDAVKRGAKEIVIGLGGSATNDGGCGCAAALGAVFKDKEGKEFVPVGGNLDLIAEIDISKAERKLSGIKISAMCDIDNPLYGKEGAAYVFGPQKGADEKTVELLDKNLAALSESIKRCLGKDVSGIPGSGAAGGMGGGISAFLGAELKPGIEAVLDMVCFCEKAPGADLIITGEGRLDTQTLRGKVISGVAKRAAELGVPVVAIVGAAEEGIDEIYDMGVSAVFPINRKPMPFSESKYKSEEFYESTLEDVLRLIRAVACKECSSQKL
ncbi:MAG: glycerate kinase [Candidatus Avilachnospira sp.]